MASRRSGNVVVHVLLLATLVALCAAAAAAGVALSVDFHALSCPQLHGLVRTAVEAERRRNPQVTAGLLRIFFHDCFPQGCDASLLLDKTHKDSEQWVEPQNKGLQQAALQLIETIRATVHGRCGERSVSCADILAVATSHAVNLTGGPLINMQLGHLDSVDPARREQVTETLPAPNAKVDSLLETFRKKGFHDPTEVVALSGAHTVGKARCSSFRDRTGSPNDDFTKGLARFCAGDDNRQQNLDVLTPDAFDNRYFVDLINRQGVLTSDQVLANDQQTRWIVDVFATNQGKFFEKFALAMEKLSGLKNPAGGINARRNCFKRDTGVETTVALAAAAASAGAAGDVLAAAA